MHSGSAAAPPPPLRALRVALLAALAVLRNDSATHSALTQLAATIVVVLPSTPALRDCSSLLAPTCSRMSGGERMPWRQCTRARFV